MCKMPKHDKPLRDIPKETWEQQKPPGTFSGQRTYVVFNVFKVD